MVGFTVYDDFAHAEPDIRKSIPKILYKYRDWSNPYHKSLLTGQLLWFAAPKELNDRDDIRVPLIFDVKEVDHPIFLQKLQAHQASLSPHLHPQSREFQVLCDNQLDLIKENPNQWFAERYAEIREGRIYDTFGVFSLSTTPLEETMWGYYTGRQGFCVGLNGLELARSLDTFGHGFVRYQSKPMKHSFISTNIGDEVQKQYVKHTKWRHEKEYRFVTLGIETDKQRAKHIDPAVFQEVVLDEKMPGKIQKEIIRTLKRVYGSRINLFLLQKKASGYGFQKHKIEY
jgi:hypothetical protein